MFLTKPDAEGIRMVRPMNTMDESFTGGHWEIEYDNLRISRSEVLGAVGEGFRYVQVSPGAGQADPLHALAGGRLPCP